jgi:surfeit locus 1 family protein
MAQGQNENELASFLPKGLKVRGGAPEAPLEVPSAIAEQSAFPAKPLSENEPFVERRKAPLPSVQEAKGGFRPMPILTIVTLICLGVLWMLGSWQWDKFVLKSAAPSQTTTILPATSTVASALEAPNPEYRPVVVDGLIDSRIIKISTVQNAVRGYRIFSPVVLEAGGIFVDRGFVAEDQLNRIVVLSGQVNLEGVLRVGARPNAYTPDNDPASDVWYWPDLPAMALSLGIASMGQAAGPGYYVSLTKVDPLGTGDIVINPYADSKGANQIPADRHLGYALTWWGFGLALIGVYIGMHVRAGRLRFGRLRTS